MRLHLAPVHMNAQASLPFAADIHLDGVAVQIRGVSREKVEEMQALIVTATNAWLGLAQGSAPKGAS